MRVRVLEQPMVPNQSGAYGTSPRLVQPLLRLALVTITCVALMACADAFAADRPIKIAVLGDSLTAGYGLAAGAAFPARLQAALRAKGHAVEIHDAGVSGDTASGGLSRLDWSVPEGADAVIVELGANDALRGIDPKVTRAALDGILRRLKERGTAVLLAGMRAPRNLGEDYARGFDGIYPELAAAHGVPLYPFFLEGVVTDSALNQGDGIHPNAAGVEVIVRGILPKVEELMARARSQSRG
jgi:acyl-CoA thioesterase-1